MAAMPTVRAQLRMDLLGAPAVGRWRRYTGAWFTVAGSSTPSATVADLLLRLWNGTGPGPGTGGPAIGTAIYRGGAASAQLRTWTLSGGNLTFASDTALQTPDLLPTTATVRLPFQCACAVGYRADLGPGVPHQRGRSRWWLGPIVTTYSVTTAFVDSTGGPRFAPAFVDKVADNAAACVAALAAEGWVLGVRVLESDTLVAASTIKVDDVIDVQRSRRTWPTYSASVEL